MQFARALPRLVDQEISELVSATKLSRTVEDECYKYPEGILSESGRKSFTLRYLYKRGAELHGLHLKALDRPSDAIMYGIVRFATHGEPASRMPDFGKMMLARGEHETEFGGEDGGPKFRAVQEGSYREDVDLTDVSQCWEDFHWQCFSCGA